MQELHVEILQAVLTVNSLLHSFFAKHHHQGRLVPIHSRSRYLQILAVKIAAEMKIQTIDKD